jgi:hypothetical protein
MTLVLHKKEFFIAAIIIYMSSEKTTMNDEHVRIRKEAIRTCFK